MTATLDIERPDELLAYLRATGRIAPNQTPRITVLAGGVSNRTVLLEHGDGNGWVLKQALEKLRVKADWFSSPERIKREALGLKYLSQLAPPGTITPLIFEDHAYHVLAMQAVPQPHENWKSILMRGDVQFDHFAQFGTLLGTIHRAARERASELRPIFSDVSFFESLRVEPYYSYSAEQVPASREFYQRLIDDTREQRQTLVHGDYSPKNVLVRHGQLVLLDHEVIHWGDPAFDLGFALAHPLSKAHHLARERGKFADAARLFWESYGDDENETRAVRHTLGCLLARVAGRSPLDYLTVAERVRQQDVVLTMMKDPPKKISVLISRFIECL